MHEPVLYGGTWASTLTPTRQPLRERGKSDMIVVAIVVALAVAGAAVVGARRAQEAATPQVAATERDDTR